MTRKTTIIRPVEKADVSLLNTALSALSAELDDPHPATLAFLEQAGFGPTPAFYALIAQDADALTGAIMFSPVTSTAIGATGTFVSDLWVAEDTRGTGLGRRLLRAAAAFSADRWGAGYLKLSVYHGSVQSRRFYDRLGFTPARTRPPCF